MSESCIIGRPAITIFIYSLMRRYAAYRSCMTDFPRHIHDGVSHLDWRDSHSPVVQPLRARLCRVGISRDPGASQKYATTPRLVYCRIHCLSVCHSSFDTRDGQSQQQVGFRAVPGLVSSPSTSPVAALRVSYQSRPSPPHPHPVLQLRPNGALMTSRSCSRGDVIELQS